MKVGPGLTGRLTIGLAFVLIAGATLAQPQPSPQAQQQSAPQPVQIDRNGVLILIRSTLLALNQANETGNYTVLRDLAAPGFATANTAARLAEIFASQRAQKLDLSGVGVIDPQLIILPQIEANGLMRMAGFFPSAPNQVNFELLFAPVDGRWRVFGIAVNVGSAVPAAPQAPQPQPQAQRQPAPQPTPATLPNPEAAKRAPKPAPHTPPRAARPAEKPAAAEDRPGGP